MGNQATMTFNYPAPVPVGHRVEVSWPELNVGLLNDKMEIVEAGSIIHDLDTGIHYGANMAFCGIDDGNAIGRRVEARIEATRLVTTNAGTSQAITTTELTLMVEPS